MLLCLVLFLCVTEIYSRLVEIYSRLGGRNSRLGRLREFARKSLVYRAVFTALQR
jgi:hypothetical protein